MTTQRGFMFKYLPWIFLSWIAPMGCQSATDPAQEMIARVDQMPPDKRPPDWERTKSLMQRPAPKVGDPAPDFTLKTTKGGESITLSRFHPDRPRVLIFASFT